MKIQISASKKIESSLKMVDIFFFSASIWGNVQFCTSSFKRHTVGELQTTSIPTCHQHRDIQQPMEEMRDCSTVGCAAYARQPLQCIYALSPVHFLLLLPYGSLGKTLGYGWGFVIFRFKAPSHKDSIKNTFLIDFPSLYQSSQGPIRTGFHKVATIDLSREYGPSLLGCFVICLKTS